MIKYLEVCIIIHTFAKPYTGSRGKGREKSKQINITMNIKDIRKELIGKHLGNYNSFNGILLSFPVGEVTKSGECYIAKAGNGYCAKIYIPKQYIGELIERGYYCKDEVIDGCRCFEEWKIY